ncbi:MAG: hypothetical protein WBQ94_03695 [Terracidiphilus sp.]
MDDERWLFNELQGIVSGWQISFARAGLIMKRVNAQMLWRERIDPETEEPCVSFSRWVRVCAPLSVSTCYQAMRAVEELSDVPDEEVAKITSSNFPVVLQLSSQVRNDPQVLKAAQTESTTKLVEHIQQHHPSQHLETRELLRFRPSTSAAAKIKETLCYAQMKGATTLDEALEYVCAEAMASWKAEEVVLECMAREQGKMTIQ